MADPATLIVAEQVVSTTVETGAVAAYGLAQKTQPLAATFTSLSSPAFLQRSHHTLTVVNGKGYIWGGYDNDGNMAGTDMNIVQLPVKGKGKGADEGEAEYKVIPALGEGQEEEEGDEKLQVQGGGEIPAARADHTASTVGELIYVFGGTNSEMQMIEEKGRVWVFNTSNLHWSFLDPEGSTYPSARYQHGGASTEHPLPPGNPGSPAATYKESIANTLAKVPSLLGKVATETRPHGTLLVCSGLPTLGSTDILRDIWTFDIAARTWTSLPSLPSSANMTVPPSVAFTHNRLYAIASSSSDVGSELLYFPLPKSTFYDHKISAAEADPNSPTNLQPMFTGTEKSVSEKKGEWTTLPFPTNPLAPGPRPRRGAGLVPITTGNGREYLLYFLGQRIPTSSGDPTSPSPPDATTSPTAEATKEEEEPLYWSDIWSYQTPAQAATASGIKDATRSSLGIATGEGTWAEVKVVADVEETKGEETEGKSHPGPRGWFASGSGDGDGVVLWGGRNGKGETEGDGWIVRIKTE